MLKDVGVSAMPTLPFTAPISPEEAPFAEFIDIVLNTKATTFSLDVSEPPAFTVSCGLVGGLPVGQMLVIRDFEEPR
jgi:amidase